MSSRSFNASCSSCTVSSSNRFAVNFRSIMMHGPQSSALYIEQCAFDRRSGEFAQMLHVLPYLILVIVRRFSGLDVEHAHHAFAEHDTIGPNRAATCGDDADLVAHLQLLAEPRMEFRASDQRPQFPIERFAGFR